MFTKERKKRDQLQKLILSNLGYSQLQEKPQLERARKLIKSEDLADSFLDITDRSQKKKRRIKEGLIGTGLKSIVQGSEEMKELQWRLEILREDRKDIEKKKESFTFDELYKRQKNKYLKFRQRQKIKISDPKYLDMIGSTQMRRQKRKLENMQRIEKQFEALDERIKNHVQQSSPRKKKL